LVKVVKEGKNWSNKPEKKTSLNYIKFWFFDFDENILYSFVVYTSIVFNKSFKEPKIFKEGCKISINNGLN